MPKHYRIGTRGSLLALTQTTLMKEKLEALTGDHFEIITMKTQGDQIVDRPLWQIPGKDFFTKELDEALIAQEVDLVVHSYKDLGTERPQQIMLAALTKREAAHDILLMTEESVEKLGGLDEVIIGTSSPRRIATLPDLAPLLPGPVRKLTSKVLRGNVNTRIQKLRQGEYHGIILALAGLTRLAQGNNSRQTLQELLKDLRFMVLPLSRFPSAAAQGALGIECLKERQDQGELLAKLKLLEDAKSRLCVDQERRAFKAYGGGCHLAVGIHVAAHEVGRIECHRGEEGGRALNLTHFTPHQTRPAPLGPVFYGMPKEKRESTHAKILYDECLSKVALPFKLPNQGNFFVTSSYALPHSSEKGATSGRFFWAAGLKTWKKLASAGFWVNGCSDFFGQESLEELVQNPLIEMLTGQLPWHTLTAEDALSEGIGQRLPCYQRLWQEPSLEFIDQLQKTRTFFWSSFFQFRAYSTKFPFLTQAVHQHASGLGKTLQEFSLQGVPVIPFLNGKDFLDWAQS